MLIILVIMIHALVVNNGFPNSFFSRNNFFTSTKYSIGPYLFSLNDIEHGILRCNMPMVNLQQAFGNESDPRLKFCPSKMDPRVHFAFSCGECKYATLIKTFTPENVENELEWTAQEFCDIRVKINVKNRIVMLPKIFEWYQKDFLYALKAPENVKESKVGILVYVAQYLSGDKKNEMETLIQGATPPTIQYDNYSWTMEPATV